MRDYDFAGGTAVVTGAASGIGEALAVGLSARGSDLALLDRDADRLDAVAERLRAGHPHLAVRAYVVDLADPDATAAAATAVLTENPGMRLLVNNASTSLVGRFDESAFDQVWALMEVNVRATVQLTHVLLPALAASPGSHLANVSSAFGLLAPPRQAAYAMSKFAVRGLTEALRAELRPLGVGVTSVHPGGTSTRLPANSEVGRGVPEDQARLQVAVFDRLLRMPPQHVAEVVLRGLERRRPRVLIGATARVPDLLVRLAPGAYTRGTAAVEGVVRWGLPKVARRRAR